MPAGRMTIDDVAQIALALPGVTEGQRFGHRTWLVAGKSFAWVRPLSKADVGRLGEHPVPKGPLLAVRVADLDEKEVLMMDPPAGFFDIQHFSGYPAVLVELDTVNARLLQAAVVEAWYSCAPADLAAAGPPRAAGRRS
jgi:hypothetical protein